MCVLFLEGTRVVALRKLTLWITVSGKRTAVVLILEIKTRDQYINKTTAKKHTRRAAVRISKSSVSLSSTLNRFFKSVFARAVETHFGYAHVRRERPV